MNSVNLIGRLATDVQTHNGASATLLAVHRSYNSKDGVTADFIPIVGFNRTGEILAEYCKKGEQVGISGEIKTSRYPDENGEVHYSWNVVIDRVWLIQPKDGQNAKSAPAVDTALDALDKQLDAISAQSQAPAPETTPAKPNTEPADKVTKLGLGGIPF